MEQLNYVAIDKEGVFVTVMAPEMPAKDLAKEIARCIRQGDSIYRADNNFVRQYFGKPIPDELLKSLGS